MNGAAAQAVGPIAGAGRRGEAGEADPGGGLQPGGGVNQARHELTLLCGTHARQGPAGRASACAKLSAGPQLLLYKKNTPYRTQCMIQNFPQAMAGT